MDSREIGVTRVQLETRVYRVQEDIKVHSPQAHRVLEVSRDSWVRVDPRDLREHKETRVHADHRGLYLQEYKDTKVLLDTRVQLDQFKKQEVLRVQGVHREELETRVT